MHTTSVTVKSRALVLYRTFGSDLDAFVACLTNVSNQNSSESSSESVADNVPKTTPGADLRAVLYVG